MREAAGTFRDMIGDIAKISSRSHPRSFGQGFSPACRRNLTILLGSVKLPHFTVS
jgi:hypothetical protein